MPQAATAINGADQHFMQLALEQAAQAGTAGEVPIGAVVVREGELLGSGSNRTRRDGVIHAHAELNALGDAQRREGDYRLDGAEVYVTVEPCMMCLGAIYQSRITRIVYGAAEPKFGAVQSRFELGAHPALRKLTITGGVLALEAAALLAQFFQALRSDA
jgi:tRNA(Arg) A34 adenosine deaminase TadA